MSFFCIDCKAPLERTATACPRCGEVVTDFVRRYLENPVDGKYRLVSRLGRGGMGEVYKAMHVHLDAVRVLKLMRPNLSNEKAANDRFIREAKLATRIHNPYVATLHDFSLLPDGSYYMVWEYIDGTNLTSYLRQSGPLSPKKTAMLAIQALNGLEAIHRAGIIHRDVSPDNLMIIRTSTGEEEVKVIDLGIAKFGDERATDQTRAGEFIGKLKYCSPEHLGMLEEGEKIDGRADIYSMGLVMYEMLTGRPAFVGTSPHHYVIAHSTQTPRPLREVNPVVQSSPELEALLFRAMEKDRDKRFATARDFAKALERLLPTLADAVDPSLATTVVHEIPEPKAPVTQAGPTLVGAERPSVPPAVQQKPPSNMLALFGLVLVVVALLGIAGAGYAIWRYSRPRTPEGTTVAPKDVTTTAPASVVQPPRTDTTMTTDTGVPPGTDLTVIETPEETPTPTEKPMPPGILVASADPGKGGIPSAVATRPPPAAAAAPPTPVATRSATPRYTPAVAATQRPQAAEASQKEIALPEAAFTTTLIRNESLLTKDAGVRGAWVAKGVKLQRYRIRVRSFRNATSYESAQMMSYLEDDLQDELNGLSESDADPLTADGLITWAESSKSARRGIEIEMVFRDSSGGLVAELRHRIYESSPEDAAEEMIEAVTDFVEDHRVR